MRWTPEQYADYMAKRARSGARPQQEEQEVRSRKTGHSKTRMPEMVRPLHPKFCLTVAIFISDRRRRDLSGALATIEDCLIDAVRQLPDCLKDNLPQDDSWQWIEEITIKGYAADAGQEGALIKIEQIV